VKIELIKRFIVALLLASILVGSTYASITDEIEEYTGNLLASLMLTHTKIEGNFLFSIIPMTPQYLLAQTYPEYLEKRYSQERILKESRLLIAPYETILPAGLLVSLMGDWDSKGETSKTIPEDLSEYLFVENDSGDYARCLSADIPFMENTVNVISDTASIAVKFSLSYERGGKQESILENTEYIEFVIGGIGFKDNRIRYELPLFVITEDLPEPLRELFIELGLTEYP